MSSVDLCTMYIRPIQSQTYKQCIILCRYIGTPHNIVSTLKSAPINFVYNTTVQIVHFKLIFMLIMIVYIFSKQIYHYKI